MSNIMPIEKERKIQDIALNLRNSVVRAIANLPIGIQLIALTDEEIQANLDYLDDPEDLKSAYNAVDKCINRLHFLKYGTFMVQSENR